MRILGLPGRLPETFGPMQALLAQLTGEGDLAHVQRYAFWSGDHANPDLQDEAAAAAAFAPELVVAKSIGCLVAIEAGLRNPCVMIGAPVNRLAAEGRLDLLAMQAREGRTLFLQQTHDPTGTFADLCEALGGAGQVCELSGGDHLYDEPAAIAGIVRDWLGTTRWA